jgi:heme-degrading monooxygenase HmoA
MNQSIICAEDRVATLINVFTVEPDKQQELIDLWIRATEDVLRHLPGFISANVHRGLDGTKVINYAQWRSAADFAAMRGDPRAQAYLTRLAELGTPAPLLCEVVSVHHV